MTQDEIIEMAIEAGFEIDCCSLDWHKRITAFANLVAEKKQDGDCKHCVNGCPACDARKLPPQRTWVNLTYEQVAEIYKKHGRPPPVNMFMIIDIENKIQEINT